MITKALLKSEIDNLNECDLEAVYNVIKSYNHTATQSQGVKMAAILQLMADRKALAQITDPVEWQRSIRQDQALEDIG